METQSRGERREERGPSLLAPTEYLLHLGPDNQLYISALLAKITSELNADKDLLYFNSLISPLFLR